MNQPPTHSLDAAAAPPSPAGRPASPGPAALWAVLWFTALNSMGTGAVQTGVFFLLQSAYAYGRAANFLFGLVLFGSYIAGAVGAAPLLAYLARLPRRRGGGGGISERALLLAVTLGQVCFSLLPKSVSLMTGAATPPEWTMWAVGVGTGLLSGCMWPIVESYLSGARRGRALSRATGRFNVVWSGAVVASFWLMAPLLEHRPLDVMLALGVVQAVSVCFIAALPRRPGAHADASHEPHPAWWRDLLAVFRVLLPLSYFIAGALSPMLPTVTASLGVAIAWRTPLASAWLLTRVAVFFVFERWDGWHGSRAMPIVSGVCMLAGFAGAVGSPFFAGAAGSAAGIGLLIVALGLFGVGHAMCYLGALYYAMEVGAAEVGAGGAHEALIGVGYGMGPLVGLGLLGVVGTGRPAAFDGALIGVVALVGSLTVLFLARKIRISRTPASAPGAGSETFSQG